MMAMLAVVDGPEKKEKKLAHSFPEPGENRGEEASLTLLLVHWFGL